MRATVFHKKAIRKAFFILQYVKESILVASQRGREEGKAKSKDGENRKALTFRLRNNIDKPSKS